MLAGYVFITLTQMGKYSVVTTGIHFITSLVVDVVNRDRPIIIREIWIRIYHHLADAVIERSEIHIASAHSILLDELAAWTSPDTVRFWWWVHGDM